MCQTDGQRNISKESDWKQPSVIVVLLQQIP